MSDLEILLRGVAAGSMLATAAGLARGEGSRAGRAAGCVFCLSAAAFAVHSGGAESRALGPFLWIASLLSAAGAGSFWLFALSLFGERRFRCARLVPIALLTGIAAIGWSLPRPAANGVWIVHNAIEILLVGSALVGIGRSWRDDLVEARRSLRGPFIAAVALYAVVLSLLEIAEALGHAPAWLGMAQAATLAALGVGGASVFLGVRPGLFDAPTRAVEPEAIDPRGRQLLAKLDHEMRVRELWRQEGLRIGTLAAALDVPEHRLRRLINDGLGHRNFAEFLSAHRIAAAKRELADPRRAERTVSEIAFALGYASLGPFNRAFRESTGTTPSAFRAQALAGSPSPEIPR